MLAFDPTHRQSLAEIVASDPWFNSENQMSFTDYVATMDYIHSKIS